MGRLLEEMPVDGRRLCMMSISTRHFPESMDQLAAAAAPFFERFVVAGSFRKGVERSVGETARLMGESLLKAGLAPEAIVVEADEYRAMDIALDLVRPGDLLLFLVGRRYEAAWAKVQALRFPDRGASDERAGSSVEDKDALHMSSAMQSEAATQ